MDQVKTGKFIQSLRKDKGLTQGKLAEMLNISDKTVSKWETGKGLPEVGLMLPLCEILKISVNELLSGEKLDEEKYVTKAEENIMKLIDENREARKKLILSIIVGITSVITAVAVILVCGLAEMPVWARAVLISAAVLTIVSGIMTACFLDKDAGVYECPHCGCRFVPDIKNYVLGAHTLTRRKLKCPECGKRSYCRKRISVEK